MSRIAYYASFEKVKENKHYRIVPLSSRILVVASINEASKDWSAYIDNVSGTNHEKEWKAVAMQGTKLNKHIAFAMFPELEKKYKWRA